MIQIPGHISLCPDYPATSDFLAYPATSDFLAYPAILATSRPIRLLANSRTIRLLATSRTIRLIQPPRTIRLIQLPRLSGYDNFPDYQAMSTSQTIWLRQTSRTIAHSGDCARPSTKAKTYNLDNIIWHVYRYVLSTHEFLILTHTIIWLKVNTLYISQVDMPWVYLLWNQRTN